MDSMTKISSNKVTHITSRQISSNTSSDISVGSNDKSKDPSQDVVSEEEREKGWSDMTETEGSESDDDEPKLVIDVPSRVSNRLASQDLDSTRVRSLEETMKFLEGNCNLSQDMSVDCESADDDSDEEIVVSSTGAPDKYGFLTEIYIPKMRGFEELSDRCILDSVSVGLTLDQVVRSNMDQFNYLMRFTELSDTQREVTKYVRRRARNRVSARKSRMKKLSDIVRLSSEIRVIRQRKESLRKEKVIMEKLMISWKNRVNVMQDYIIQYLKDKGENNVERLEYNNGKIILISSGEAYNSDDSKIFSDKDSLDIKEEIEDTEEPQAG